MKILWQEWMAPAKRSCMVFIWFFLVFFFNRTEHDESCPYLRNIMDHVYTEFIINYDR